MLRVTAWSWRGLVYDVLKRHLSGVLLCAGKLMCNHCPCNSIKPTAASGHHAVFFRVLLLTRIYVVVVDGGLWRVAVGRLRG